MKNVGKNKKRFIRKSKVCIKRLRLRNWVLLRRSWWKGTVMGRLILSSALMSFLEYVQDQAIYVEFLHDPALNIYIVDTGDSCHCHIFCCEIISLDVFNTLWATLVFEKRNINILNKKEDAVIRKGRRKKKREMPSICGGEKKYINFVLEIPAAQGYIPWGRSKLPWTKWGWLPSRHPRDGTALMTYRYWTATGAYTVGE